MSQILIRRAMPSFAQERLWFIEQLRPSTAMNNVPLAIRVHGSISVEDVRRCIQFVVDRHESLRTVLVSDSGVPYQEIHQSVPLDIEVMDLRRDQWGELGSRTEDELRRLATTPIPLDSIPLFRVQVIMETERSTVIQLVMHHIISDGWSLGVLKRDLSAAITGNVDDLPPLKYQQADAAARQRAEYEAGEYDEELAYWCTQLPRTGVSLSLPLMGGELRGSDSNGAREVMVLDPAFCTRLRAAASQHRVTLNMLMLAGYAALLFRHTGEEHAAVTIGTPTAGRAASGDEQLIGFFVNTLPVTVELDRAVSVREYLGRVRSSLIGALSKQRAPFEKIVERVQPERRFDSSPLYQTIFVFQNTPQSTASIGGYEIETLDVHNGASPYGLTMSVSERGGRLACRLEYAADQLSADGARRLLRRYRRLLEGLIGDQDMSVAALPMLDVEERGEMIEIGTRRRSASSDADDLFTAFLRIVEEFPDRVAITAGNRHMTYTELASKADDLASSLIDQGVSQGDWVGVCVDRGWFLPVALLGILRAGAGYVPLDPELPDERLRFIMDDCRPKVVVAERSVRKRLPRDTAVLIREEIEDNGLRAIDERPLSCHLPAYLIYTSGSTGRPKGVVVTHLNVLRLFDATEDLFFFDEHDVWTLFHNYAFDFSVWELWGALLHGGRCVVVPVDTARRTSDFYELVRDERVTVLNQTPSSFSLFDETDSRAADPLSLRYVIFGGEALIPAALAGWAERHPLNELRLVNMYGITETTVHVTYRLLTQEDTRGGEASPIGRPLEDLDMYLLEPDSFEPVPYGVPGEICVGGAGVAQGYLNRPERTALSFVPHPFREDQLLYRSGDRAIALSASDCMYLGRYDDQVKVRGFRIELGELQSALSACPGVVRSATSLVGGGSEDAYLSVHVVGELGSPPEKTAYRGREWEGVFDASYSTDDGRAHADLRGWRSSYTGELIPEEEMSEWVDATVAEIRELAPRRVLEIGAGTGLLMRELLDEVDRYVATDVSGEAIERLRGFESRGAVLVHCDASQIGALGQQAFDTIIINSVIQYFPDPDYAEEVIHRAARLLAPGGHLFIGDVRDLRSHDVFHRSLELGIQPADAGARLVLAASRLRAVRDRELVLSPDFFAAAAAADDRLGAVRMYPRRGSFVNEMTKYRYNVVIEASTTRADDGPADVRELAAVDTLTDLISLLQEHGGRRLRIRGLIDKRAAVDARASRLLEERPYATAGEVLRAAREEATGINPDDASRAVTALGRRARVLLSPTGAGRFDLLVDAAARAEHWNWEPNIDRRSGELANDPTVAFRQDRLAESIRDHLSRVLPSYMMPSSITVLPELPLTVNGKVDHNALPQGHEASSGALQDAEAGASLDTDTERAVADIFCSILQVRSVFADSDFFGLGGHSLLVTRFAFAVADRLHVDLPLRMIFEDSTVRGIAAAIDAARLGTEVRTTLEQDVADLQLPALRRPVVSPGPDVRSVLLSGATGFVGAHMLVELLEQSAAVVHCVVRGDGERAATERLFAQLACFELDLPDRDRVQVHAGDLTAPHLGLDETKYDSLVDEVEMVYHAAADTTLVAPYSRLKSVNVGGTSRMIEFAMAARAPLHYLSTIGVFGPGQGTVDERSDTGPFDALATGYAQSKWVAERRVQQAGEAGLLVGIYRPSRIAGHSRSGACRGDDLFWRLVLGVLEIGRVPTDLDLMLDLVPVDEVAAAVVALSLRDDDAGGVYHLASRCPISFHSAMDALRRSGYRLLPTTFSDWVEAVSADSSNAASALLPVVSESKAVDMRFDCSATARALDDAGVNVVPINEEMLQRTISYFVRLGEFPVPVDREEV